MCLFPFFKRKQPFIHDGDRMVRKVYWKEFTLSNNSDVYEEIYSLTVRKDENSAFFSYSHLGEEGKDIPLKKSTLASLLAMDLLNLPGFDPVMEECEMLDSRGTTFFIANEKGLSQRKSISKEKAIEIKALLFPYKN